MTTRFLVIGCGSIGKRHIGNLLLLGERDITAYDSREDRRTEVASTFGVRVFADLEDGLLAGPEVVFVCTPTSLHVAHAAAAAAGGAHIFVEKPISNSLAGVQELASDARDRRLVTLVGCNFRFHPAMRALKEAIERGELGRPLYLHASFGHYLPDWHPWEDYRGGYSANRALGGGIILDSVHEIDYARWLLGEALEVSCTADKVSDLEIDTEDVAEITLRFENGAIGSLHMDYVRRPYTRWCEVVGSRATARSVIEERSFAIWRNEGGWETRTWPDEDPNRMYVREVQHFLECVRGREQPALDVIGARRVLEIALAARRSAAEGRRISLKEGSGE